MHYDKTGNTNKIPIQYIQINKTHIIYVETYYSIILYFRNYSSDIQARNIHTINNIIKNVYLNLYVSCI